ncbi:uncharacterized protein LOC130941056 [Arachis stenosperma]|uniref:uncharacterized protein LOC130941056 n=1 Tax=Arachis stenosperma TaxID=217475 RepID=UPI0025ACF22F|nr:uncharacterized protein LOC130941056 [Arachis stenosperma]XP_057725406.1 uncharacterized protein LOC130941056 [Arachis stenosperma]
MRAKVPRNFKSPDMDLYDGTTDPKHHLSNFKSRMYLADASDATRCKAFPTTLSKAAMKWFDSLPPRSITSFEDLSRKFLMRFSIQKDKVKHAPSLLGVKQEVGESLRAYMERFNKACLEIQDLPTEAVIMGLVNGLREGPFSQSISKRHPVSLSDVQERAEKYINMEENAKLRDLSWRPGPLPSTKEREREAKRKEELGLERLRKYHSYTPLKVSIVDVYREICNTERLPPPRPIKNKKGGSRSDYCEYHKIYGHSTNDCYDLKNVIEKLAREGRLDRYLIERSDGHGKRKRDDMDRRDPPPQTPERHIHMISGGFAGGGLTKSSRKRHLKRVYQVGEESPDLPTISFTKEDGQGIIPGHDDPVVITMILANAHLHRTLVDQGSSADILFKPAFDKLGLEEKELRAYPDTLYGLGDTPIKPLGFMPLHTTFGKGEKSKTLSIDFIVIDVGSAYNALIGRTTLNRLGAVVSTPHLCMKFPTSAGIATVKGDQKLARKCYNESLNLRGRGREVNTIELGGAKAREELRPQPGGKTEEIQVGEEEGKNTHIGANLGKTLKQGLTKLLRDNSDFFAWKASDMPGINPELMSHKLSFYPGSRPVQQRRRKLGPERALIVEEQVQALLEAGFIREVKYPTWLANVVLVKKQNGKWRMCVDYTDLNKACPKDPYPLPSIDTLVDSSSGYQYLSFMDAYSGYNQIPMYEPDQEKTSFITPRANYCYVVMPFGLNNAGATYQRLMNKVFSWGP